LHENAIRSLLLKSSLFIQQFKNVIRSEREKERKEEDKQRRHAKIKSELTKSDWEFSQG
jgi:hypothetical protein